MKQYTLSILKPDVVKRNIVGKVISYIEKAGFRIVGQKRLLMSEKQAKNFYYVHNERPFFSELVNFMISGPVIVQVLSADDAINNYRKLMGETDPKEAKPGTIRGDFAESIDANCVHGSDTIENAKLEISFFFARYEIIE